MIEVVGHGGAGDFYPGNSRASVEKAIELGVNRIEIDVQVAGDGSLVLVHDEHVLMGKRSVPIRSLKRDQIAGALDGLLTLDDVIALTRGQCELLVDMKSPGYERPVAAAIERAGIAETTMVSSTYAWSLRTVRKHAPGVALGLSTGHISTVMRRNRLIRVSSAILEVLLPAPTIAVARAIDAKALMLNYRVCGDTFVRMAHKAGLRVYPWTVNDVKPIRRMVELGVDGIISNRPDLVREAVDAKIPEYS
jgi:glycerophosphoryl diester phosphodiesterase